MIAHNKLHNVEIEEPTDPHIPPLLSDLSGGDPVAREKARKALMVIGKPVVPALIQMLSYRRPVARWEAAKALCGIADPLAATALVNALEDEDEDVRLVAAEGVAALGGDGLPPLLAALLEHARSSWFRQGAHHVCRALTGRKKLGPILRPVLAAFNGFEQQSSVPLAAYTALSKLRKEFRAASSRDHGGEKRSGARE